MEFENELLDKIYQIDEYNNEIWKKNCLCPDCSERRAKISGERICGVSLFYGITQKIPQLSGRICLYETGLSAKERK